MNTKSLSKTYAVGTRLTSELRSAVLAQAEAQGQKPSEYLRELLFTAVQAATPNPHESLLLGVLAETQALRLILVNLALLQANGDPQGIESIQRVIAHADEHKVARARHLLETTTHNQATLAASSEIKEAA